MASSCISVLTIARSTSPRLSAIAWSLSTDSPAVSTVWQHWVPVCYDRSFAVISPFGFRTVASGTLSAGHWTCHILASTKKPVTWVLFCISENTGTQRSQLEIVKVSLSLYDCNARLQFFSQTYWLIVPYKLSSATTICHNIYNICACIQCIMVQIGKMSDIWLLIVYEVI